jgi:hypothetical protein
MTAPRSRGKRWAVAAAVAAALVLAGTGFAARGWLLEPWYLSRLAKAEEAEKQVLIRKLTAIGSTGVVPILLERSLRLGRHLKPPVEHAWIQEALASPRLDPGLGRVLCDAAAAAPVRLLALQWLAARDARFDALCPGLLQALADPSAELRRAAAEALAVALPARPQPLLPELEAAMEAQASVTDRATLAAALLLWCLQLPREEWGGARPHAAAALRHLPSPLLISSALGAVEMRRGSYAGISDKEATICDLRPRALDMLARLVDVEDPLAAARAREAIEYLGQARRSGPWEAAPLSPAPAWP